MFAVREPGKKAVLFNGPQLGYSIPELFVEFELHHPGVDLRGVSAAGIPLVGIGHNDHIAWGFTSGLTDEDDLYSEKLVSDEKYLFRGAEKAMECRDESFAYKTPVTDVPGGAAPESGTKVERICRTVHGPVQVRAGKTAYARRYAIWGRELESIVGLSMLNEAKTVKDVDLAMNEVTWNENVMAADSAGNIGYWHPGLHQLRPWRFDERLPYPGTGEAEWRGLRDRKATPRVINPKQGWLASWNNLPAEGWTTGDAESNERLSGPFHRGQFLQRTVSAFAKKPTYAGAKVLISHVGTTAQQRPLAEVRLRKAAAATKGRAKELVDAVRRWDGSYHRVDGQNTVDPGVAIWEELKDQLEAVALRKLSPNLDAMKEMAGGTGSSHAFDISNGEAYALRTLTAREWQAAGDAAAAALEKRFQTPDVARWREPRRMYDVAVQGAAAEPKIPFFDRGTWEQFVEVGP
jgi:penicillin amidase